MPRYGGILGKRNKYSTFNKNGIWDISDQYSYAISPAESLSVVTNGLVLALDAASPGPNPTTTWYDLSGGDRHFTWQSTPTYNTTNSGNYSLADGKGFYRLGAITNNTNCTLQMWIKTNDSNALWASGTDLADVAGGSYICAYNSGNVNGYHSGLGSPTAVVPTYFSNLSSVTNIYSTMTSGSTWRMIEFKNLDLSVWNNWKFNMYNGWNFDSGEIAGVYLYNRSLSSGESTSNFNALRGRYGI